MNASLDVICLGELLIDFMADKNSPELEEVGSFLKAPGGAPANVAVALARLGARAGFIGRVGNDPFGRFLTDTLSKEGVDTNHLSIDPISPTPLAFVSIDESGERDFCFFRHQSSDTKIELSDQSRELIARTAIYHFGSFSLSAPVSKEATLEGAAIARKAGKLVSFDVNVRPPVWEKLQDCIDAVKEALSLSDIVKVSEEEAELLTGETALSNQAETLLKSGSRLVVITLGGDGSYIATPSVRTKIDGFRVKAIDTTGAGDAFWGGFLYRICERLKNATTFDEIVADESVLSESATFANAAGALTVQSKGAIPSLPIQTRILGFLGASNEVEVSHP